MVQVDKRLSKDTELVLPMHSLDRGLSLIIRRHIGDSQQSEDDMV